ncbi:hypothetical protein J8TS2_42340 [Lederbergia ruris]|uniref:Uncharacterized protein n=1 Tax=Lederbergia ruris TaxID=217495 RepID=A0ABQ4KPR3_9BACI|nr:hypothetical protein J8TS2_42340 [Lederbergia ruris]
MRLAEGIVIDKEKTFGLLKFSALRREVFLQNEDGTVSTEVKERTYDLKSREQGRMIQVSIPASIPLKEFYTMQKWNSLTLSQIPSQMQHSVAQMLIGTLKQMI